MSRVMIFDYMQDSLEKPFNNLQVIQAYTNESFFIRTRCHKHNVRQLQDHCDSEVAYRTGYHVMVNIRLNVILRILPPRISERLFSSSSAGSRPDPGNSLPKCYPKDEC
ncbi:hypothetical protein AVEN_199607-1 [Araneus ventricosus]|uniref:Uncharacterized protein n=1 Tax=Araneus ventricosus TaxID=182803 RepID=A0A4Y2KQJ2_ARAVE|nr:hypothetical protein AVEN_199607-1 [Araneus ventricosus]